MRYNVSIVAKNKRMKDEALQATPSGSTFFRLLVSTFAIIFNCSDSHAATIYGAPYRTNDIYITNPPFPTVDEAIAYWWSTVQARYPNAFPGCSYTRTDYVSGPSQGVFAGYTLSGTCGGSGGVLGTAYSYAPGKNDGKPEVCVANPLNAGTGAKFQVERDFDGMRNGQLSFSRYYSNSKSYASTRHGIGWRNTYDRKLVFATNGTGSGGAIDVYRADGKSYRFTRISGLWTTDGDIQDKLIQLADGSGNTIGWRYLVSNDEMVEEYDVAGRLLTITSRAGLVERLSYSDGTGGILYQTVPTPNGYQAPACQGVPGAVSPANAGILLCVTGHYGQQLNFSYDAQGRTKSMADPAGSLYQHSYDNNNDLASVTYPGSKTRTYLYNELTYTGGASVPHALTGILDENGSRFATWNYNAKGNATSSEHAGGVDKYVVNYNVDASGGPISSNVTDPLGATRTITLSTVLGVIMATGQSQPGGAGCGPASSAITYDANGNIASRTDFNGNQTTYSYDLARNLETSRTEAAGTAQARTITTEWHPTYRLPTRIAEPKRLTTNTYDTAGNLLSKTLQATSDATGAQGFSAAPVGTARTWSYTYNTVGQVLTAAGPRTDVADVTTYAYDSQGNLVAITNAANQVTTLSNYDAHGRAGRIVDPNGLVTELAYSPRGWLTSKTIGGEATSYEYDGVGQLKKVSLPDASVINYTYDDAHRLTAVADSLGNRIVYALDAMGNRISEQVSDSNGVLARQTSRIFDALNRLEAVSGGTQ